MNWNLQEKQRIIKDKYYDDMGKYTWTTNNQENTRKTIKEEWNTNKIQYFNIHINKFKHKVTEMEKYSTITKLPISDTFWIRTNSDMSEERKYFTIATKMSEKENTIKNLIKLNIPFTVENTLEITEENTDIIIREILTSKSISISFKDTNIIRERSIIHLVVKITLNSDTNFDIKTIKKLFYQDFKDKKILICDIIQESNEYNIYITGTLDQMEQLRNAMNDNIRMEIIEGDFINNETEKQYMINKELEKKQIIKEAEEEEFNSLTIEDKSRVIKELMESLKSNIIDNNKNDIRTNISNINKHIGLQLYNDDNTTTWYMKYIRHGEQMFDNQTKLLFKDNDIGVKEEMVNMIKCPHCNIICNNITWIQNHLTFDHGIKLRNDIPFTLQYALMSNEDNTEIPITQTCYKCPFCEFTNNEGEHVIKHCITNHKKKKNISINEGIIGTEEDIKAIIETREKERLIQIQEEELRKSKMNTTFKPKRINAMDATTYYLMRNRECIETQTEKATLQDIGINNNNNNNELTSIETQTGEIRGGARNITTPNGDRLPQTAKEVDRVFNIPILKIRKNLKSNLTGLFNSGASCYMNSLIQALHNITPLRKAITEYGTQGNTIATTLNIIFKALDTKQDIKDAWYVNLDDTNIYSTLNFDSKIQSDPSEVLLILIDKLTEVNEKFGELFEQFDIKRMINTNEEIVTPSTILNIRLPEETDNIFEEHKIEDLINKEVLSDDINEDNIKISTTYRTISSDILSIKIMRTTKRFSKDLYRLHIRKTLAIQGTIYELKSIIVHHGQNVEEGHYTTYIINDNNTFHINDMKANKANIKISKNYVSCDNITEDGRTSMVFYQKINNPSVDIIRENTPTMEQVLANTYQMNRREENENEIEQSNTEQEIPETTQIITEEEQTQQNITLPQNIIENTSVETIEKYTTLMNDIPMKIPNEEEKTWIKQINEMVNQKLAEANNPKEFIQKIQEIKTESGAWNKMPNLHEININNDINIITMAIIKGTLPIAKEEKICGYPNCPFVLRSGIERTTHWKKIHNISKCNLYNPLEEILEIQGKDIATYVSNEDELGYIKYPLF